MYTSCTHGLSSGNVYISKLIFPCTFYFFSNNYVPLTHWMWIFDNAIAKKFSCSYHEPMLRPIVPAHSHVCAHFTIWLNSMILFLQCTCSYFIPLLALILLIFPTSHHLKRASVVWAGRADYGCRWLITHGQSRGHNHKGKNPNSFSPSLSSSMEVNVKIITAWMG